VLAHLSEAYFTQKLAGRQPRWAFWFGIGDKRLGNGVPGYGALGQVAQSFNVIIGGLTRSFNVLIGPITAGSKR